MCSDAFHAGERKIQAEYGLSEKMQAIGATVLRPFLPEQHRRFFETLPWVFLGAEDREKFVWASLRIGSPGFVSTPNPRLLRIQSLPFVQDPLSELQVGQDLGILGLEFETRRRNRVSTQVVEAGPEELCLSVRQSFGNCPKYIQIRTLCPVSRNPVQAKCLDFNTLAPQQRELIENSDCFFIASVYQAGKNLPSEGADLSHRGGKPGFVRVESQETLLFPDFSGNRFFNTLGNIVMDPRVGLLFLDFVSGDLLFLSGRAEIIGSGPELQAFQGAERLIRFRLARGRMLEKALPWSWDLGEASPALAFTGSW
ncbi:flavin-nucleotide-binding protein [bacterium (Candidatus Blackallbacteria) CG17_big_fil_post_rev_8_21_14_2_50_48_46]|uniref:Flavin-nucleotide-binding protein n=1 Tax=bacterium (Candidatus Blackallbacteria) CG17_big_fil_post_rev_8_21_14_2_50_48_46 TaxID=2014261 RepID=A0A2M7G682_9BACT|nr:MAG: flavin-nucleotide-binding protein [bacterium (Candidatus Blackallbacteria) CG18_big_fil_WC_8_21_14_2_50_49_26]PIW17102.1 MAG: flavin-nucleotide-binding protein [bacterium (Candidatus Blackallbacteria) CG17_big_fil_post_rev_8_21_14_2_50_48_46]PIW50011.1 MAG: flavin-nucleotide-binding protein [bacterium (Candidatus Blackallbacteria) CG13_big_fil_rev_8_21_14_2_50_49_14]